MENKHESNPTISDIAKRCGVTHPTVSRILRGTGRQSQATIDLVLRTAKDMGYDPARSHAARRMISQRFGQTIINNMISLWFPRGTTPREMKLSNYMVLLENGMFEALAATDFELCTCDSWRTQANGYLPESFRKGGIDGVLTISQASHWAASLNCLRSDPGFGTRPIVGLTEHLDGASGVYADNTAAGRLVISHLLDLGHRSIAHFELGKELDNKTSVHSLRLRAYEEEYRSRGLSLDSLFQLDWTFGLDISRRRFIESIKAHPEITAVIAHNDLQAGEVYDALTAAGHRVPQDISLISYDDTDPIILERRENMLTSLRLPLTEIGREATNLLIRRIKGEETTDRDILLPVELVVRRSTAPPPR